MTLGLGFNDLLVYVTVSAVVALVYRKSKRPLSHKDIIKLKKKLEKMDPYKFEEFCGKLFKALGYKVKITPKSRDGGKDLILNNKVYVECKHYKGQVGRPIAQKLKGAMDGSGIQQGIIITTGRYSAPCIEYCNTVDILCLDFKDILDMCQKVGKQSLWF